MKIALVGSRYFGAAAFEALRKEKGVEFSSVVVPAADDRLALAAKEAGVPVHVLANPKMVPGEAVPQGTDLIVAAHTHARVSDEALAHSRLGGVGYHPSLLPRHRGIAAVEWTIKEGDPIAGGSVYHLADGWDKGGDRRAGMVLRRAGRDGARVVGARTGPDRPRAPAESRAVRPGARPRAEQAAGSALRDQGADDSQSRRAERTEFDMSSHIVLTSHPLGRTAGQSPPLKWGAATRRRAGAGGGEPHQSRAAQRDRHALGRLCALSRARGGVGRARPRPSARSHRHLAGGGDRPASAVGRSGQDRLARSVGPSGRRRCSPRSSRRASTCGRRSRSPRRGSTCRR